MSKMRLVIFGLAFAALSASTHLYQLIIESWHLERAAKLGILTSSSFALLQMAFILSFIAFAVGLLMRTLVGRITSILGLIGVLLAYTYWYSYSYRWLMRLQKDPFYMERPEFVPPHSFGLVGAHWWDAIIMVLSVALLILILTGLLKLRRSRLTARALGN